MDYSPIAQAVSITGNIRDMPITRYAAYSRMWLESSGFGGLSNVDDVGTTLGNGGEAGMMCSQEQCPIPNSQFSKPKCRARGFRRPEASLAEGGRGVGSRENSEGR